MKTGDTVLCQPIPLTRFRLADYVELTKPRVAVLVLFTVAVGAFLAAPGVPDLVGMLHALIGTSFVVAGASALNQFLERHNDNLMQRTENRPLPSGRLQPIEVLLFGIFLGLTGVTYLVLELRHSLAAFVAGLAYTSYVGLYTPLKTKTTLNTLVGAVAGALPPVIGWTAVTGTIGFEAVILFMVMFLWQVPHFLAIAWIYRHDYARGGFQMLTVVDSKGTLTGRQMVAYCMALIPVSLMPAVLGIAGPVYLVGAVILGLGFLATAIGFVRTTSVQKARRVLRASLIYLPALLALLLLDGCSTSIALALGL